MTIDWTKTGNMDQALDILTEHMEKVIKPRPGKKTGWLLWMGPPAYQSRRGSWQEWPSAVDTNYILWHLLGEHLPQDPYWKWLRHKLGDIPGITQFMSKYRSRLRIKNYAP